MLSTILSIVSIDTWSASTLLGFGLLTGIITALALSSQRWLLRYLFGGIAYWLSIEFIHSALMYGTSLSDWHGYVAAMGISWLPLFIWVLYRALRYDDVSYSMEHERALAAARYVEHSPIYDDNYQPRFE